MVVLTALRATRASLYVLYGDTLYNGTADGHQLIMILNIIGGCVVLVAQPLRLSRPTHGRTASLTQPQLRPITTRTALVIMCVSHSRPRSRPVCLRVGHPAPRPFFMVPEMCFFCSILHIFFHYIVKRFKKGLYMTLITCVAGLTTRSYVVVLCSQRIIKNSFIKRIYRGPYRRQAIPEEEAWNGGTD